MKQEVITQLSQSFNQISHIWTGSDVEYWFARDLQEILEYSDWRNFLQVLGKAKEACNNAEDKVENHFVDVTKMVTIGSGAEREIDDVMLTRYACYLVAQNGDPRKDAIDFAQSYFALQTRKQELIEEQLRLQDRMQSREKLKESETELSKNIYERGVDDQGFGRIRSRGDAALFGGKSTQKMKDKLSVPKNRALADFFTHSDHCG